MPNFVFVAPSIAELARGEKWHTQSPNHSVIHSPSLFDVPGTEAFTSEQAWEVMLRHFTFWISLSLGLIAQSKIWNETKDQQKVKTSLSLIFDFCRLHSAITEAKVNLNLPHYALLVLHVRDTLIL